MNILKEKIWTKIIMNNRWAGFNWNSLQYFPLFFLKTIKPSSTVSLRCSNFTAYILDQNPTLIITFWSKEFFWRTYRVWEIHIYITMLTWHIVQDTEIPIINIFRLNIFNCHLHFAATNLSQAEELGMN